MGKKVKRFERVYLSLVLFHGICWGFTSEEICWKKEIDELKMVK